MKKIIVTGATGLIGSHLLEQLASHFEVHAISRNQPTSVTENVVWHQCDLNEGFDYTILPVSAEAVVYLAQSEDFREFPDTAWNVFQVNTAQMLGMLNYARKAGVKSFINASSGGVYGMAEHVFSEEIAIPASGNIGFYLSTKLCSEILAENYKKFMNIINLRFFFVYGKGQKRGMLIPRLVDNIREGNPINLEGDNGLFVNPTHVLDAVACILAALKLKGFHNINVAGPEVLSLRQISEIIGDKVGVKPVFKCKNKINSGNLIGDTQRMRKYLTVPNRYLVDGLEDVI